MSSILIGIVAVLVGLLFCFRGVIALRIILAVWVGFVGFVIGGVAISEIQNEDVVLNNPVAWIVAIVTAIAFGLLAYYLYAAAVVIAMASIGYALGIAVMTAFGVTWSWAIILVGVILGIALATATLVFDLPMVLLASLSALGGATIATGGIMLLTNTIEMDDFNRRTVSNVLHDKWWWYLVYFALVAAGILVQAQYLARRNQELDRQDPW
ncbi:DUF4203 domain-containing protein [Gordonia sp. (in: high G+C Gram-positive bacteria)]